MLLPAAGYIFHLGYVTACTKAFITGATARYRLFQAVECVFWLLFSVVSSGCFDGWTRIRGLLHEKSSAARKLLHFPRCD